VASLPADHAIPGEVSPVLIERPDSVDSGLGVVKLDQEVPEERPRGA
jgi:hypothetical protein